MKNNSVAMRIAIAKQQGVKQGRKQTIRNYSAAVLLCLKDKFGFTTEQLQEAAMHINNIFSSIGEGYLSLKDIEDTLKEENNIDMVFITAHNPKQNEILSDIPDEYKEKWHEILEKFLTKQKGGI